MIYSPTTLKLKDGRQAILRSPEKKDAADLIRYLQTVTGETEFLSKNSDECFNDVKGEENWIESANSSPDAIIICCEVDGKIIGNCDLQFFSKQKSRHRVVLGIAIMKAYWGLGIGTEMFRIMIETAKAHPYTEIMELQCVDSNTRARKLYEKMGFTVVASLPDALLLSDGQYHAEIFMQKKLK